MGTAWRGQVGLGQAWLGQVRYGWVRYGWANDPLRDLRHQFRSGNYLDGIFLCALLGRKEGKMTREQLAEICHSANKTLCEHLGDTSQPAWADAPQDQKDSAITGVSYHLDNIGTTPESGHQLWMNTKLADGWTLGEVKDPVAKTHPSLVPFYDLPEEVRAKDHLFHAIVNGLGHFVTVTPVAPPETPPAPVA